MDFFLIPERNSAPLQQSLLGSLQSYLNGMNPQESAIGGPPLNAADNLAELYQIRKTMEGCVPVLDGQTDRPSSCIAPFMATSVGSPGREAVCHVFNSVSSNLNTEATCVTTVALPDVAAWQLGGRLNPSATPNPSISSSRGSSSPTMAANNCLAVNGGAAKVGKKRSRASRRAPTTLLNTDTSNFRAMVQQFTGISNAPFASSASNFSSAVSSAHNSHPKPFAQRLLGQNFNAAAHNNNNPANLFPPLAKFPPQHSSLPIFPFQSLRAEDMNNPFPLPNFFGNKGGAHGISEGQLISAMNAGPVLGPNQSTALSFGPT